MEDDEFIGCGRGGRGALLRAALQKQTRRPGATDGSGDTTSPTDTSQSSSGSASTGVSPSLTPVPSAGRGALLEKLMLQSRSSTSSSSSMESSPASTPAPGGRGILTSLGRCIAHTPAGRGVLSKLGPLVPTPGASAPMQVPAPTQVTTPPATVSVTPSSVKLPAREMQEMTIQEYRGTTGTPVSVEVNYLRLKTATGMGVFEYHVDFVPHVDSKDGRFQLMRSDPVIARIGSVRVFDGAKLYLPNQLPDQVTSIPSALATDGTPVMVHVKFVKKTPPSQCVHLYNVLFKKVMHSLQLTRIGRNYFDYKGKILIPQHRLEVWPGYVQAVAEYEGGLLLNCDASFRVLRTITAREVLFDVYNAHPKDYKTKAVQAIVGNIVLTRYNNKTYRVDDIAWDLKPTNTFTYHTGEEISYLTYYKRMYNIDIQDKEQPLLLHRDKPRKGAPEEEEPRLVCLVPELCSLTGLTDEMRSDFRIMKDIASHTRVNPNQRQLILKQFVNSVTNCPEAMKVLGEWGIQLESGAVSLGGRILQEEKVMMKSKSFFHNGTADWSRLLSQDSVIRPVPLENWVVMFFRRDGERARNFTGMMSKVCPSMGIMIQPPMMRELSNDSTNTYVQATKEVINPNVQVIVFIFPTSRDDRYSAVKRLCCVDMPVPSQVIISNTIGQQQKLRSVTQKVALQINCKLGGELWAVDIPMNNVMVVGIDVYHDVTRGRQSVLGFVASLNRSLTRWFSKCSFQDPSKELVNSLKIMLLEAIVKYHEVNHRRPDNIIVFRDGVGDGQLSYVCDYEVEQLYASFGDLSPDYKPPVAVVVVQKRINTRIFAQPAGQRGGDLENPAPGTVVDHTVTRREWCDFFLVSQKVRQGTVSPTHYVVLRNTTKLSPDHLQRLTYKLTHLYYNWPGTIRVPAPCQYAHKLANLVGDSIHREPDPVLSDRLFYL